MNDPFAGKTPSISQLSLLRNNRKKLKAKADVAGKKIITNGMVDPQPCVVCATIYERYRQNGSKPENCRGCQAKLDAGQCCVVCKVSADGLYDGRYIFLEPNSDNILVKNMVGQIVPCTAQTMDLLLARKEGKVIIIRCHGCGFNEEVVKGENDPKEAVTIQSLCPDCRPDKFVPAAVVYLDKDGKVTK